MRKRIISDLQFLLEDHEFYTGEDAQELFRSITELLHEWEKEVE